MLQKMRSSSKWKPVLWEVRRWCPGTKIPEEHLYTTPEDMLAVYEALHPIGRLPLGDFGNVHGHYKPGAVKLRPQILGMVRPPSSPNMVLKLRWTWCFMVAVEAFLKKFARRWITGWSR